ncbi:ParB/RepB/Spo0J family partition protein [Mesorhizobium sp. RP14(2022)]|uniref:ParB/RepB/Spo0J family partition protein n=1 Tax=Mesorhizobium liriopis TaxID=2953882 RepID=A0ABT1C216_9HYPH|nr:ParB/RepB/Spo0J family partition protein [Mesorhizobium liriopis]MCO6048867.1 ParB/RepB/Spo0J family partition protein [Mesorhizobium liriopis]
MNDDQSRKRLGRGLAALLGEIDKNPDEAAVQPDGQVPLDAIAHNKRNPRRSFSEDDLDNLARSIQQHGLVQPIVVRPLVGHTQRYEIIAGERRWRAAQKAGLAQVPVILRDVNDRTALELAIVENVQRSDLNPVEEALGYQQLIEDHNYTQADLGQVIGKSRSYVANTLRLLKLPDIVRDMLVDGQLSAGHARALITVQDPVALAQRIVEEGLSVRQAEAIAQGTAEEGETEPAEKAPKPEKDADTRALEKLLADVIGLKVAINHKPKGGELRIGYKSLEQLDDLCRRLKG